MAVRTLVLLAVTPSLLHAAPARPTASATTPRLVAHPEDPREQRIQLLRERLEGVLGESPLRRSRVGVEVMTASDGDVLYDHNGAKLFNPASNTKILTTAAALAFLGPDYRYRTTLHGPEPDADGVVHGDVELRGSGDPSLTAVGLAELARDAAARGITRIEGALHASDRFRDPVRPERPVGDHALILHRNTIAVRVRPTEPNRLAEVSVEPAYDDFFVVENRAKTVARKRTRLRLDVRRGSGPARDHLIITVRGRVGDRSDVLLRRRIADGALVAGAALRQAFADHGIELAGPLRTGELPRAELVELAEHRSAPLSEICRISNKESNNFVADTLFKTVGGERYGLPGTLAEGTRVVADLLRPLGVAARSYTVVNGSGLTHANRIQPAGLAQLLRHLYFDLSIAPEFLSSLAVGGIDGTIRRRFLSTGTVGRVRAKTGTLSGVSALSGYVGDGGDVVIFSILVEGFRRRALPAVRRAQVRMVEAMLAFLRADRPPTADSKPGEEPAAFPPGFEGGPPSDSVAEPEEDSEADGDPTE